MKVIYVNAKDLKPEVKDVSSPEYKSIGNLVGGYMEIVRPIHKLLPAPFVMIVNEDGLSMGLYLNYVGCKIYPHSPIVGNIVIAKESGLGLETMTDEEIETIRNLVMKITGTRLLHPPSQGTSEPQYTS